MQKTLINSVVISIAFFFMVIVLTSFDVIRKHSITFLSADSLLITADEYLIKENNPYILLFHQQQSSRGEYYSIARKLCKMDYNCLAVDTRNGGNNNHVSNETVKRCRESRCHSGVTDVENDILASINFAYEKSNQPVILMGSGVNGSLCLKIARENNHVRAVIALSPGEYFLPDINIHDTITNLKKPIFVTSTLSEYPFVSEMVSGVSEDYLTIFKPQMGEGRWGTLSLSSKTENHSEYWLALLLFFKDLV